MAAAVLADLPPGKGLEEEIEADLGTGASKVWKEVVHCCTLSLCYLGAETGYRVGTPYGRL